MITAITVLLLSAVGGGIVGALVTSSYPKDEICQECREISEYQKHIKYKKMLSERQKTQEEPTNGEFEYNNNENENYNYENYPEENYR